MLGSKSFLYIILGLLFTSCTKYLDSEEYSAFVSDPENGLRKDESVSDFKVSVMYEPTEYIISQESPSDIESRRDELNDFEHFQFRIELLKGGNILTYKESASLNQNTRINHFSFYAKEDFKLVVDEDTSNCSLAIYSRNYNLTPTVDLTLSFKEQNKESDWQLIYDDSQFGLGRMKFLFDEHDLKGLPVYKS